MKQKRKAHGLWGKRLICALLIAASLFTPVSEIWGVEDGFGLISTADAGYYEYTYYPQCASWHTSLVTALNSVGVTSTYNYRKNTIAPLNGYTSSSYTGTAAQNTALLNLLKQGKLVKSRTWKNETITYYPKCASSYTSLVNALKSIGVDSSYNYRKYTIAPLNGYTSSSYTGTAAQNTALLNLLKQGKLVKSKGSAPDVKEKSTLQIGSGSYLPGTLTKGQAYYVSGNITSNYKITSVTVGIYRSSGSGVYVKSASPNATSYNISKLDSYMKFGSLAVGSYVFKVTATDAYPNTKTLVNHSFSVVNPSSTTKRSKSAYNATIDKVNVYNYTKKGGTTYCNIFVQDVMDAMGLKNFYTKQRANATYQWLNSTGKNSKGWKLISAYTAQQRANSGYPTLVIWYNTKGDPGHVALVRPETSNYPYNKGGKGPVIANAGASTFAYGYVKDGFGSRTVQYWTHD